MTGLTDQFEALAGRLDELSEEIAELAIAQLHAALRRGESTRPDIERRLTQARRAIDKATQLLRTLASDERR